MRMVELPMEDFFIAVTCITFLGLFFFCLLAAINSYIAGDSLFSIFYVVMMIFSRISQIYYSEKEMGGIYMFSIEFEMAVIMFLLILLIVFICDMHSSCKYRKRMLQTFKEKENWFLKESAANKAAVKSAQGNPRSSVPDPDYLKGKSIHNEQK